MDKFNLEQSLASSETEKPKFSKRYVVELPDSNGGNYQSSQIVFNLPSISNQDAFLSLRESYVSFPYIVKVSASQDLSVVKTRMACLKAGFQNLIAGISVNIDNNQVQTIQELDNVPLTWKIISQSSQDDAANLADTLNFAMDNEQTLKYIATSGESNGKLLGNTPAMADTLEDKEINTGFATRCKKTSFDPTSTNNNELTDAERTKTRRKSYVVDGGTQLITYQILATLPLRFLSIDLFEKMQLVKGMYLQLSLNIHSGTSKFTMAYADGAISAYSTSSRFGHFPVMIAEKAQSWNTTANCDITITSGLPTSADPSTLQTSALFHAVFYRMRPEAELSYLQAVPSKKIQYTTTVTNVHRGVTAGSSFNFQISASLSKMRWLLIHTSLNQAVNGSEGNVHPFNSPFTSCPMTTCKHASISDFQVKIAGSPLYENPKTYTYDMFMNEIRGANSLYGGLQLGLSSGLLNERMWSEGYGYIFVNLNDWCKETEVQDATNRAIEVLGRNNTKKTVDYHFWVGIEQEFTLNSSTGKVSRD